jgi:wyosine [tRNA(Phe)-imidazoG37] synthetase (radical SAM superfamily)
MELFYGPVLSRRFGYSLGVDIIPYKICSYDCIYCQLGSTTKSTIDRKSYVRIDIDQFKKSLVTVINRNERIDYITFSGSGEPTLNKDLGILIDAAKEVSDIPVAVLTNGSLLYKKDVIDDICKADLVKVSMDAFDQESLEAINRPHPGIKFSHLSRGLDMLMKSFDGRIWLEIMLIKGINDSLDAACGFEALIEMLLYSDTKAVLEKIHLNTPVRPTEGSGIGIPDSDRLEEIREILGGKAEIIKEREAGGSQKKEKILEDDILELARRRPVTTRDISRSLDVNINEVIKVLKILMEQEKIGSRMHNNQKYYYL